jgi:hypothetical protein
MHLLVLLHLPLHLADLFAVVDETHLRLLCCHDVFLRFLEH